MMIKKAKPSTTTNPIRIAIIGGGPAGLLLARLLVLHNDKSKTQSKNPSPVLFDVKVYERDASPTERSFTHGGSLDLHTETGQYALKKAGLLGEFHKHVQEGAEAMTIVDAESNQVLYQDGGNYYWSSRPEIERSDLCRILLDSLLNSNVVQWGHKLMRVQEPTTPNGSIDLFFDQMDQPTQCDILVGADGAWSKVRSLLSTAARPLYTGVSFWELTIRHDNMNKDAGKPRRTKNGTLFALDEQGGVLIAHFNSSASHVYVGRHCESGDQLPPAEEILKDWSPALKSIVEDGEYTGQPSTTIREDKATEAGSAASRKSTSKREIYALPVEALEWARPASNDKAWLDRVTVIGDAAHLMSPMAGEGVNLALKDAADLADVLISSSLSSFTKRDSSTTRNNILATFEQRYMFRRAQAAAKESQQNLEMFFFPNKKNKFDTYHNKNDIGTQPLKPSSTSPSTTASTTTKKELVGARAVAKQMRDMFTIQNMLGYCVTWMYNTWEDILWYTGWKKALLSAK